MAVVDVVFRRKRDYMETGVLTSSTDKPSTCGSQMSSVPEGGRWPFYEESAKN